MQTFRCIVDVVPVCDRNLLLGDDRRGETDRCNPTDRPTVPMLHRPRCLSL